jgi:hypothetical protein
METKVCTSCGQAKPLDQFHRFGKDLIRVGKWCEECFKKKKGGAVKKVQSEKV